MTLVNPETNEVVAPCTEAEARDLTDRIRSTTEALCWLVDEAHERKAWKALGYGTWDEYVAKEFQMSSTHSYRLLDQAKVIRAIDEATPEISPFGEISEVEAREIKPVLEEVTGAIKERIVEEAVQEAPERVEQIVSEEILKARSKKTGRSSGSREQRVNLIRQFAAEGFDADQIAERIGMNRPYVMKTAGENDITLADHIRGKTRRHDANRIVAETVAVIDGAAFGLRLVDHDQLDREKVGGWFDALDESLKELNAFKRTLKEMTQ